MTGQEPQDPDYQDMDSLPELYDLLYKGSPDLSYVATTLRYSVNASHQKIGGILYDGKKIHYAKIREVTPVVDRVGSGDGLLQDKIDNQHTIDFAAAACCVKHTITGDFNLATLEEIEQLAGGNSSGKVSR